MHLDGGQAHRRNRVAQGIAVMGVRARVDDDAVTVVHRGVQPVNQRALGIGLEHAAQHAQPFAFQHDLFIDGGKRIAPVNARFPDAGQVQVWTVHQ